MVTVSCIDSNSCSALVCCFTPILSRWPPLILTPGSVLLHSLTPVLADTQCSANKMNLADKTGAVIVSFRLLRHHVHDYLGETRELSNGRTKQRHAVINGFTVVDMS